MNNEKENYTFYELIKNYKVIIPIIQRDYAQGRINNQEICKNFLNTIKESIINKKAINLDFVYGNINNDIFQPLDGQQRLTTLFLLHWYSFMKEKSYSAEIRRSFKNFSYETRLSSRRYCEALVEHTVSFDSETASISKLILDSEWFFISWKQDATIRAMLNSIDIIHSLFKNEENIWDSITNSNLISFHLLVLENFGLSDDLYIKMNARGKLLTPFENLKAEIQDKVLKNEWEKDFLEIEKFYHKVDTLWTDFLWTDFRKNNAVDEAHMDLISTLIMFKLSTGSILKGTERIEVIRKINENNSDRNLIHYIDEDAFKYICTTYNLYSDLDKRKSVPDVFFCMWRHETDRGLLRQILNGDNTSYTHKVLFYAQTEYLLRNKVVTDDKFLDWMRVIRNIVSRGDITIEGKRPDIVRSPETFYGMINLVHELANGCNDIYEYLDVNNVVSSFAKEQVKEEMLKAHIICEHPQYKELLITTEDNDLLRGRIIFALECAGYKDKTSDINFETLENVQRVFNKYFNKDLEGDDCIEFDLLRRAMLTIEVDGKYQFYNYWSSYWYAGEAEKRRFFALYREIEYFISNEEYKIYFKKLINILIKEDYYSIISNFTKPSNMENWQYRLIKEKNLLENCKSKYIAISEDRSYCYLLKSKRPPNVEGSPIIK